MRGGCVVLYRGRCGRTGAGIGRSRIGGGFLGRRGGRLGLLLLCLLLCFLILVTFFFPLSFERGKIGEECDGGERGKEDIPSSNEMRPRLSNRSWFTRDRSRITRSLLCYSYLAQFS